MHRNGFSGRHFGRRYVVTGADSGIGLATAALLEEQGAIVIRCGLESGDVTVDLSTGEGRRVLVREVQGMAPEGIDGVALVAGTGAPSPVTVRVNFFGTVEVLSGLRPLLGMKDAPRVSIVSSLASVMPADAAIVEACLRGDEDAAVAAASRAVRAGRGRIIYGSTKLALNRWLRMNAVAPSWTGAGITLNAIAPGVVDTEAARRELLADPVQREMVAQAMPQPLGFPGPVRAIADAIAWTLSRDNGFMTGQVIFVDGGAEATLRRDGPFSEGVRYGILSRIRLMSRYLAARRQARP